MVIISDMPTIEYWHNMETIVFLAKYEIPKEFRVWDTWFTSLSTIKVNLLTRHWKKTYCLQKYSKDILSVIITLGTNVNGGETIFNWMNVNYIGKRVHVLKNAYGVCVVVEFDNKNMKDLFEMDKELMYPFSYINQYFFTLYITVLSFTTSTKT